MTIVVIHLIQDLNSKLENVRDREQRIIRLETDITELNTSMKEISLLVFDQGSLIGRLFFGKYEDMFNQNQLAFKITYHKISNPPIQMWSQAIVNCSKHQNTL